MKYEQDAGGKYTIVVREPEGKKNSWKPRRIYDDIKINPKNLKLKVWMDSFNSE
jgi:hypothetical protein